MIPAGCVAACPACAHRDFAYSQSLEQKQGFLASRLVPFGKPEKIQFQSLDPWGYRRSVFLRTKRHEGQWVAGVLRKVDREEEIVPIPECPIQRPELNEQVRNCLSLLASEASLPLFGILVRGSLLTLVLKCKKSLEIEESLRSLDWEKVGATGVHLNFHESAGSRITHPKGWVHLWGEESARLEVGRRTFTHGPSSFLQQIPELHERSIDIAESFFGEDKESGAVLDLYSGIGISLERWKACGYRTLGVEVAGDAVRFAQAYSDVLVGRVEQRLPQIREWCREITGFAVYANPSRLGLESSVCEWIAEEPRIRRVAYLSCSPGTLSRDLETLTRAAFEVRRIIPFDFLPYTSAVETLVLLQRRPLR